MGAWPLLAAAFLGQVVPPDLPTPFGADQVIDWAALPPVPYRIQPELGPEMHNFVAGEVAAGRCKAVGATARQGMVQVDVAMLITPEAGPRMTIPRAINCSTVEQYAAGLVLSFSRNNLNTRAARVPQWYRATLRFRWPG